MNKYIVLPLVGFVCLLLILLIDVTSDVVSVQHSDTGCCSIKVEHPQDDIYVVTYIDHIDNTQETVSVYLEQPAVDMTDEEALLFELDELINKYQEVCYHNHYTQ